MTKVLELVQKDKPAHLVDPNLIAALEGLLERAKEGKALAVGFIEVCDNGDVCTFYSKGRSYHQLNSGAARLAARLALD